MEGPLLVAQLSAQKGTFERVVQFALKRTLVGLAASTLSADHLIEAEQNRRKALAGKGSLGKVVFAGSLGCVRRDSTVCWPPVFRGFFFFQSSSARCSSTTISPARVRQKNPHESG